MVCCFRKPRPKKPKEPKAPKPPKEAKPPKEPKAPKAPKPPKEPKAPKEKKKREPKNAGEAKAPRRRTPKKKKGEDSEQENADLSAELGDEPLGTPSEATIDTLGDGDESKSDAPTPQLDDDANPSATTDDASVDGSPKKSKRIRKPKTKAGVVAAKNRK